MNEPPSTEQILKSFLYRTDPHFADPIRFYKLISPFFDSAGHTKSEFRRALREFEKSYGFLKHDITQLRTQIKDHWAEVTEPLQQRIDKYQESLSIIVRNLNLQYKIPEVYIVDQMPAPFDKTSFDALCVDKFDEQSFGIAQGIYFLKQEAVPDLLLHTYAHEMVHHLVCEYTKIDNLARGLEEGVCELFGALYLDSEIRGIDVAFNIHKNSMFTGDLDEFWEYYNQSTRAVYLATLQSGIPGVVKLILSGRDAIKALEHGLLSGKKKSIRVQNPKRYKPKFATRLEQLYFTFSRYMVVDLNTYRLLPHLSKGKSISDIARSVGWNVAETKELIEEFQDDHFLLLLDDERIKFSDVESYLLGNFIRYSLNDEK